MIDARLPVRAFFTDRTGGVSASPYDTLNLSAAVGDDPQAVAANRARVMAEAGGPVVYMRPEHGATVVWIDESFPIDAEPPVGDVLITTVPGVALATLAGDCVPLLMHDATTGAVVAAHVGRKGLMAGAVDAAIGAIATVRGVGTGLEGVTAAVGPAICGQCYEVPEEMAAEVAARYPVARAATRWGTHGLDIGAAVAARVRDSGIPVSRVERCTYEDDPLFSYRRDRVTGRQAGIIRCAEPSP